MNAVSIKPGNAPLGTAWLEPICQLYAEVFSQPPFAWDEHEAERHRTTLRSLLAEPKFAITTATVDNGLVGFAYGVRVPPDTRRWQGFATEVPEAVAQEWPCRTCAVIDMAVRQSWRGQGIGRRLLETLLGSRDEERATLTVEPIAEATQGFYRHLGWQYVGRKRTSEEFFIPWFDVYVLPLKPQDKL
jgi:GNAT superfamily N-acetyltransferase